MTFRLPRKNNRREIAKRASLLNHVMTAEQALWYLQDLIGRLPDHKDLPVTLVIHTSDKGPIAICLQNAIPARTPHDNAQPGTSDQETRHDERGDHGVHQQHD